MLSFESLAYRIGPWQMSGNLGFGRVPITPLIRLAHFALTVCINNVLYVEHLLSFEESGILVPARQNMSM